MTNFGLAWALLIVLLSFLPARAQRGLQINLSAPEKTYFQLAANGYWVLEKPQATASITNWPDSILQLEIFIDQERISRKMDLSAMGIHNYVLEKNFLNQWVMRYRGEGNTSFSPKIPFTLGDSCETCWYRKTNLVAHQDISIDSDTTKKSDFLDSPEPIPPLKKWNDSLAVAEKKDSTSIEYKGALDTLSQEKPTPLKPIQIDSIAETTPIILHAEVDRIAEPMDSWGPFTKSFETAQFEFDRLKIALNYIKEKSLNSEEIGYILNGLQYDQTRLQFISKLNEKQNLFPKKNDLKDHLDYEFSKQQLDEILKN